MIKGYSGHQFLIPGGSVESHELGNLEAALKRELLEELGITPLEFIPLPNATEIEGIHNTLLRPFVINKWDGEIPEKVLDTEDELVWAEMDHALNSPILPTQKIAQALKEHLNS